MVNYRPEYAALIFATFTRELLMNDPPILYGFFSFPKAGINLMNGEST